MKQIIYFFVFLIPGFVACQNNKSKYTRAREEIEERMETPTKMNVGKATYTLYVPNGWTTYYESHNGIDYHFLAAPKTAADPNTSINVIMESMRDLSLEDFRTKAIEYLQKVITSAEVVDKGGIKANGLDGLWYNYTMEPSGVKASLISYIFPRDGVAYVITAGTQLEDAVRYRSTFDSVARSLRFE